MSSKRTRLQMRVEFLRSSALFLDLHGEEILLLAELCQEDEFEVGEIVFRQNDAGNSLYIVVNGQVEIIADDQSGGEPRVITALSTGEFFGEMSLLEKSTRSATVRVRSHAKLLSLTTEDLYSFAKIFKNGFTVVIINIARILSQRLRQTTLRLRGATLTETTKI